MQGSQWAASLQVNIHLHGSMVKDMRDHLLGVRALWWTLLVAIALHMHATS